MTRSRGLCPKAQQHPQWTRCSAGGRGAPAPGDSDRPWGFALKEKATKAPPCHAREHSISARFQELPHPYQGKVLYCKAVKQLFQEERYTDKCKAWKSHALKGEVSWLKSVNCHPRRKANPKNQIQHLSIKSGLQKKKNLTEYNKGNCFVPQDSKTLSILQRWRGCLRKQWIRKTGTFSHPYWEKEKKNRKRQ